MKAKVLDCESLVGKQRDLIGSVIDVELDKEASEFHDENIYVGSGLLIPFFESELEFLPDTDLFLEWLDEQIDFWTNNHFADYDEIAEARVRNQFRDTKQKYLELKEE